MKRRGWDWMGHCALAILLVSGGITIGTYFDPRAPAAATAVDARGSSPIERPSGPHQPANPATSRVDSSDQRAMADGIPEAPGFQSFRTGDPAPAFAGEYAVLRGAETEASVPGTSAMVPAVEAAPASESAHTASSAGDRGGGSDRGGIAEPSVERVRPSPAQGIPRGVALRIPLLGVARAGGRVVLHDLGVRGGPVPAGIEGAWGVVGRCDRTVLVEFGLPTRRAGELRAIGRADGGGWSVEPLVPRQACESAGGLLTRPRAPTGPERATFGALGADMGFAAGDLHEVARVGAAALLLVFRSHTGTAAVIAVTTGHGVAVALRHVAEGGDGGLRLLGVYRMGSAAEVWMVSGPPDSPHTLLTASSLDLRSWSDLDAASLRVP